MVYIIKKIIKFFIITAIILFLLNKWLVHTIVRSNYTYALSRMGNMVEEILDIPYRDIWQNDVGMNYGDLEDISYDEWMNMDCKYTDATSKNHKSYFSSSLNAKIKKLDEKYQRHLYCIRPKSWTGEDISNIEVREIDSPALVVVMNEYILKYPKVLNNIIKIAEKPCMYLQNLPSREYAEKLLDKEQEYVIKDKIHFKDQTRRELFCDTTIKKYTIIRIVDSDDKTKYDIVVTRIDLPEKKTSWWDKLFL